MAAALALSALAAGFLVSTPMLPRPSVGQSPALGLRARKYCCAAPQLVRCSALGYASMLASFRFLCILRFA